MEEELDPESSYAAAKGADAAEFSSQKSRGHHSPGGLLGYATSGGRRGGSGECRRRVDGGIGIARGAWDVYCDGPLLRAVQMARLFPDCKTFVDMPMKQDPADVLEAFEALDDSDRRNPEKLASFVAAHFDEAGSDLRSLSPEDFSPDPPFLASIYDDRRRAWARSIHGLWVHLVRKPADEVAVYPDRCSLLPRRHPFVMPGGRFRESYYWDTFWTIRGLLVSGMVETARGAVLNLLDDVDRYGFVPNGGRLYYTERSHPPLLSDMVCEVYSARPDRGFLARALPLLEVEHAFWMDFERGRAVCVPAVSPLAKTASANSLGTPPEGGAVLLNRYWGALDPPEELNGTSGGKGVGGPLPSCPPRPESYREDMAVIAGHCSLRNDEWTGSASAGTMGEIPCDDGGDGSSVGQGPMGVCHELAAAAESGWDFSSRWAGSSFHPGRSTTRLRPPRGEETHGKGEQEAGEGKASFSLLDMATTAVVPVDLNAFLHRMELNVARLHHALSTPRPDVAASDPGEQGEPSLLSLDEMQRAFLSRPRSSSSSSSGLLEKLVQQQQQQQQGKVDAETGSPSHRNYDAGGGGQAEPGSIVEGARPLPRKAMLFCAAARARAKAMEQTMWDDKLALWRDLLLPTGEQSSSVTPACFVPMWAGLPWPQLDGGAPGAVEGLRLERCVQSLRGSGLVHSGGVCTSLEDSGQQWDGRNAWPPLQWLLIQGLRRSADAVSIAASTSAAAAMRPATTTSELSQATALPLRGGADGHTATPSLSDSDGKNNGSDASGVIFGRDAGIPEAAGVAAARDLADELEEAFLTGAFAGWEKIGAMMEKYNAVEVGQGGGGGEYDLQVGFGWTNGVALDLMDAWSRRSSPLAVPAP